MTLVHPPTTAATGDRETPVTTRKNRQKKGKKNITGAAKEEGDSDRAESTHASELPELTISSICPTPQPTLPYAIISSLQALENKYTELLTRQEKLEDDLALTKTALDSEKSKVADLAALVDELMSAKFQTPRRPARLNSNSPTSSVPTANIFTPLAERSTEPLVPHLATPSANCIARW